MCLNRWGVVCYSFAFLLATVDAMIDVYVVPHSHDDVGWVDTLDVMYDSNRTGNNTIKNIYDTVTAALAADKNRRFISVEMYWLHRWWTDERTTAAQKSSFASSVDRGQIEFVTGGWVMHDEAVTHYEADINQMTLGHEFISETFGEKHAPRTAWHIDPFGSVGSNAAIFAKMAFDAFGTNRIPEDIKTRWANEQSLDFMWTGTHSDISNDKIFTHVMDAYGYCPPNVPRNWAFWDDYNYWLPKGGEPSVTKTNVHEFAANISHWFKVQSAWRRTEKLLWPFGCDLEMHNATLQFDNMDKILAYINAHTEEFGITVQYSTLSEYFKALNKVEGVLWPARGPDDFTFLPLGKLDINPPIYNASLEMKWWSGFFTSRPVLKRAARSAASELFAVERLMVQASKGSDMEVTPELFQFRSAVGIVQHHDALPGTCRPSVMDEYLADLSKGRSNGGNLLAEAVKSIMFDEKAPADIVLNTSKAYIRNLLKQGKGAAVVVSNPLGWSVSRAVELVLANQSEAKGHFPLACVQVQDANGALVPSQLVTNMSQSIFFFAQNISAMGYSTFFVKPVDRSLCVHESREVTGEIVDVENDMISWRFDGTSGRLLNARTSAGKLNLNLTMVQYPTDVSSALKGDAYSWCPASPAAPILTTSDCNPTSMEVIDGKVVSRLIVSFNSSRSPCINGTSWSTVYTVFKVGSDEQRATIDVEIVVGPDVQENSEVAVRIKAGNGLDPNGEFYSDEGGFHHRKRTYEAAKDRNPLNNIAANFYPVISSAFVRDDAKDIQLTGFTTFTHGITGATPDATLEIMLHRTIDNGFINLKDVSTAYTRFKFLLSSIAQYNSWRSIISQSLEHPPTPVYSNLSPADAGAIKHGEWKLGLAHLVYRPLAFNLPKNIHMLTMEAGPVISDENARVIRFRLAYLEPSVGLAKPYEAITVNVTALLAPSLPIVAWQKRTLSGVMELSAGDATRMHWPVDHGATSGTKAKQQIKETRTSHIAHPTNGWSSDPLVVSLVPLDIVTVHMKTSN